MWIEVFGLSCKCTTSLFAIAFLFFFVTVSIGLDFVPISLPIAIQLRRARSQFIFGPSRSFTSKVVLFRTFEDILFNYYVFEAFDRRRCLTIV